MLRAGRGASRSSWLLQSQGRRGRRRSQGALRATAAPRRRRAAGLRRGKVGLRAPVPGRIREDLAASLGAGIRGGAAGFAEPVVSGGIGVDVVAGAIDAGVPAPLVDPAGLSPHGEGGKGEDGGQAEGAEKMLFHGGTSLSQIFGVGREQPRLPRMLPKESRAVAGPRSPLGCEGGAWTDGNPAQGARSLMVSLQFSLPWVESPGGEPNRRSSG